MAVEKTRFDDWLKENLWRDLIFRSLIWVSIASLASYFTVKIDAADANSYFKVQTNSVFRLSNVFGTIAIFLGLVALMFKDMEVLNPTGWGRNTRLGGIGGFFRRLAGDLTLWTLGALVTVLLAITVFGAMASGASWRDWAIFSFVYLLVAGMCFAVAYLNVYVRRSQALLSDKFKSPKWVFFSYIGIIGCCPVYLWFFRH